MEQDKIVLQRSVLKEQRANELLSADLSKNKRRCRNRAISRPLGGVMDKVGAPCQLVQRALVSDLLIKMAATRKFENLTFPAKIPTVSTPLPPPRPNILPTLL